MGLDDFRREIDQLAKLKMNVLQFYWGMGGPWVEFSYGGKKAEIFYPRSPAIVAWPWPAAEPRRLSTVGPRVLSARRLSWSAGVCQGPDAGGSLRTARGFLREIIRYAHSRKVQVWLAMGEIPLRAAEPGPARFKADPAFYCGVAIPHGEPAVLDIWEAALRSMIETYPEADRYWVVQRIEESRHGRGRRPANPGVDP